MLASRVGSYLATFGTPCRSHLQWSTTNLRRLWSFLSGSYIYRILDVTSLCLYKGENGFLQNKEGFEECGFEAGGLTGKIAWCLGETEESRKEGGKEGRKKERKKGRKEGRAGGREGRRRNE